MSEPVRSDSPEFDAVGADYDAILADTVGFGGEPTYFHRRKALELRSAISPGFRGRILDFGCGVGGVLRELVAVFPDAEIFGYDPSTRSVDVARSLEGPTQVTADWDALPLGTFDVALVSNVLHHIEPGDRAAAVRRIHDALVPGGRLGVMEHNPFNPATRWVVRTCPFDEGVVLLRPGEVRRLLRDAGFGGVRQRYTTFFPQLLGGLQPLERWLGWCPAGAQTFTMGRKAGTDDDGR